MNVTKNKMEFDTNTNVLMLWYIWQAHLKPLFERYLGVRGISLERLTEKNLNDYLPISNRIEF
jgi:hypothetical protein